MKKIIYVDVDGCICTTSYGNNEDFKDTESSYINVVPYHDRIERINGLFESTGIHSRGTETVAVCFSGSFSGMRWKSAESSRPNRL